MHIILDIDGTLIDGNGYQVYPRPYLKEFFDFCFSFYESVSIWTAAGNKWYNKVYNEVFKSFLPKGKAFRFVFTEKRCVKVIDWNFIENSGSASDSGGIDSRIVIKPLLKVWKKHKYMTRHNTLIVDDTPYTYSRNYGNAIPIRTYKKKNVQEDTELLKLQQWIIKTMSDITSSVRSIEKRYWSSSLFYSSSSSSLNSCSSSSSLNSSYLLSSSSFSSNSRRDNSNLIHSNSFSSSTS